MTPVFDTPEWLNNLYRRAHADELNQAVQSFLNKFTMAEITELLQAKGLPCVPVNTPMGFANDEHVRSRGFMAPVEHVGFGSTEQPAMPFVIDGADPPWAACRFSTAGKIVTTNIPLLKGWFPRPPRERERVRAAQAAATVLWTACVS